MGRLGRRIAVLLVVLAIAAAVGWHLRVRSYKAPFEARVAALRAAGEPTRFTDLATPPIPDEENGAKLIEEARRLLEKRKGADPGGIGLVYGRQRTGDVEAELAIYLDSLAPYFDLLAQVPHRPGWRLDLDWGAGIAMRIDLFGDLSQAREHILARVEVDHEEKGQTERAAQAAVLFLGLGEKCRGPYLLGHLIAEQVAADAARVLRIAMRQFWFDAALFRRIVDPPLARSIPERGPPSRVFVEERASGIAAVEAIADGAVYSFDGETISFLDTPLLYRSGNHFLDVMEKALARCDTTPEEAIAVADDLRSGPEVEDPWFGKYQQFCAKVFRAFADHVANRRLARVVMALLEHRQREGKWPDTLAALGEMPNDPYSRAPFVYERTEHGCRVRSAKEGTQEELGDMDLLWILDDDQMPAMTR